MNVAIIPARGGSKRIPRKNIKNFHGKPLIAYSIEAAINSGCFEKVIVSTDDKEIAEVAEMYGATVPFIRPSNISDDYATTMDVIQHAVRLLKEDGLDIKNVCCIYATAPFLQPETLRLGLTTLEQNSASYAFSATSFPFPIQRAIKLDSNSRVSMFNPEHMNTRSQDLTEAFHDAGQFYWGTSEAFEQGLPFFTESSVAVQIPRKRVQDIDTPEDWEIAEIMFSVLAD